MFWKTVPDGKVLEIKGSFPVGLHRRLGKQVMGRAATGRRAGGAHAVVLCPARGGLTTQK